MKSEYDYIIIGAGSAGCVVAARLLEAKAGSVLVLEAGEKDSSIFHTIPATVIKVFQQKSWPYMTVPQQHCNQREMILAQGKVLGGGSSVNGMIYCRGQRHDYDLWASEWGCNQWSYQDVLPFFKKAENNESLGDQYHGQNGILPVSENRYRHPLTLACIRAGQEMGMKYVTDINGWDQDGVGFYQTTTKNGERASTSKTYLKSVLNHPNLTVQTEALVHKIEIEGHVAKGVTFSVKGATPVTVKAKKEVIVSAGAIGSPKVLMLSGIGPKAHLEELGITCRQDLPVGDNFHDHLHVSLNATVTTQNSLIGNDKGFKALKHGIQWYFTRSGLLTTNILEGAGFIDTSNFGRPDVQFHFLPVLDNFDNTPGEKAETEVHGLTIKAGHIQPKARGKIRLKSSDPKALPIIDPNFLGHQDDIDANIRAIQAGLRLLQQPALKAVVKEVIEPANVEPDDIAGIDKWMRQNIKTVYHPAGSCKMGNSAQDSVTGQNLKVHGFQNLRVIDCSICPQVPSGNTNAIAIMIGERGADFIVNNA
ncbi:GMC family oxidoreductase N-terminal domain-containing protein [Acinetobacter sp. ANC 3882]|uniref:GMC family oxidoreductase n=1 Tax=Acinetobacter sp. ANC 3882 TaxID=2923423 RepID=UPI001F4A9741|nr:GMC family oxidoreductase N-terminal domain-containing protein [Acinetobacter sp. ANC 3882]MCH7315640.1 GMC family oxidoreductase N-terminal domain-containing protein [Acinetobacter sp. ANC 3882]